MLITHFKYFLHVENDKDIEIIFKTFPSFSFERKQEVRENNNLIL